MPLWAIFAIVTQKKTGFLNKVRNAFQPTKSWGPENYHTRESYNLYMEKLRASSDAAEDSNVVKFVYRRILK